MAGEVQTFSTSMSVDQLHSWLVSNHLPQEDCKKIRDNSINGMAFKLTTAWKDFGISPGGMIILNHIAKEISSSPNPSRENGGSQSVVSSDGASTAPMTYNGVSRPPVPGRIQIKAHHYSSLSGQLRPCAANWEDIATALGFKAHEIAAIKADPMKMMTAPRSWMDAMIGKWSHWATGDARGSKDYATLEALKKAVDQAGLSDIAASLKLANTDVQNDMHMASGGIPTALSNLPDTVTSFPQTTPFQATSAVLHDGGRPSKNSRPTVNNLAYLGVIDEVSSKWRQLGLHLGLSTNYLDGYRQQSGNNNSTCCEWVFSRWISSGGCPPQYPLSWKGVHGVLCDIGFKTLAEDQIKNLM